MKGGALLHNMSTKPSRRKRKKKGVYIENCYSEAEMSFYVLVIKNSNTTKCDLIKRKKYIFFISISKPAEPTGNLSSSSSTCLSEKM